MPNPPGGLSRTNSTGVTGMVGPAWILHAILTVTLNKIANRLHLIRVTCQWRDKLYVNNPPL
jgi:hypothetical protein